MKYRRPLAYVLVFISGVATMFAIDRLAPRRSSTSDTRPPEATESIALHETLRPIANEPEAPVAPSNASNESPSDQEPTDAATSSGELVLEGMTEPAAGRYARLPLATSQPVAFVDVRPGDRIKKGWQVFSHWESPERLRAAKTEAEKAKKEVEVAQARLDAATQAVDRLERLKGTVAAQEIETAQSQAAIRRKELESAELAMAAAESLYTALEFEFNQAFVTSPIDGIVAAVDVLPGERRQLGGAFRGVIVLDPRVLHCRCWLDAEQLAKLTPMQSLDSDAKQALRATIEFAGEQWQAKVVSIGLLADEATGRVPLLLEVSNDDETLRAGVKVTVRLTTASDPVEALPRE